MTIASPRSLIAKYNRPGPRYTSYPTALQFVPVDDPEPLFADSKDATSPISLYYHLPFCESLCWFCACTTVITCNRDRADIYLDALEKEMDMTLPYLNLANRQVNQLHYGGGSPSFLTAAQLDRLCTAIRKRFPIDADAEISAELDPRTLSEEKVKVLASHGFNRVSFGVQDVDPKVQKAIHRIQPDEMNRKCVEWVRASGIESLNVDLIYGLPYQTVESFRQTLQTVLSYSPDRFAIFSYAHVPWVAPAQKILERSTLPEPEVKFTMLIETIETLTANGYVYIGMDHFAKADDEMCHALDSGTLHRNFQGYTTKAGSELCGFGMSSISQNSGSYRQNMKELKDWHEAIEADKLPAHKGYTMTEDDKLRREIIMKIMCSGNVVYQAFNDKYGIDFRNMFQGAIAQLEEPAKDGLVEFNDSGFRVTNTGRLLLRNIAMPFDAYLQAGPGRHAKTI
ncbi:MAG TPA: oxygen-independent coproporphyrinogen III oxidase [Oceanipulchritudo sp.]|nr:oxygen-independent coproporphyrinogen III oxidase [Oceanipulchritudo sp.]